MEPTKSELERGIALAKEYGLGRNTLIAGSLKNVVNDGVRRIGYRGFLSMVWVLFQQNRALKRHGVKARFVLELPLRWFR